MYIKDGSIVVVKNPDYIEHFGRVGIWYNPPAGWETGHIEAGCSHLRLYPDDVRTIGYSDRIAL